MMLNNFSLVAERYELDKDMFSGILKVVTDYARALDLLDDYDHHKLKIKEVTKREKFKITYAKARKVIDELSNKFNSSQFGGKEKDNSFKSSIRAIYQTFDGKELYPSVEEKASDLLYFIIKNHSFTDGKRELCGNTFLVSK